jgi:hypothetical protein
MGNIIAINFILSISKCKERVKRKEMKVHKMLAKVRGETNGASSRQPDRPLPRNDINEANLTTTKLSFLRQSPI